jgi:hypothetical protein
VLCGLAAREFAGGRAGVWAGVLTWLTFAQVQSGVNARPYAVAIMGTAAMLFGYLGSIRSPRVWTRALFVLGATLQFWAHFLMVLPLCGLIAAHVLLRALRERYQLRTFLWDLACIAVLCAPAWPYLALAYVRPQHVTWLDSPRHSDIAALLAPFALILGLHWTSSPSRRGLPAAALALLASSVGIVVALECGLLFRVDVVAARYLEPLVLPVAILAGMALTQLSASDLRTCLLVFVGINAAHATKTLLLTGTFSGLGVEDWRTASETTRGAIAASGADLVLLRSGFVEESLPKPGAAPPATRAVLDGPGQSPLRSDVVSLTYRWSQPEREAYFSSTIAPRIASSRAFLFVAQRARDSDGVYTENAVRWIQEEFGSRFYSRQLSGGRGVDVNLFIRR